MNTTEQRHLPDTPERWHWAITPQQVAEIKQGNRETINKVYFDNLPKFRKIARKCCSRLRSAQSVEDCLQQIYVDLPTFHFDNAQMFYWSVRRCCAVACGCLRKSVPLWCIVSYDEPLLPENDFTLLDKLTENMSIATTDDKELLEQDKRVVEILQTQKQLTELQLDYLVAVAYSVTMRRGLYADLLQSVAL